MAVNCDGCEGLSKWWIHAVIFLLQNCLYQKYAQSDDQYANYIKGCTFSMKYILQIPESKYSMV